MLLIGQNPDNPKPACFKLTKNQLFPEKALVWDYFYDKSNQGGWIGWVETMERTTLAPNAKVLLSIYFSNSLCCFICFCLY